MNGKGSETRVSVEPLAVQHFDGSVKLWSGDLGLTGEGGCEEIRGEIYEVGILGVGGRTPGYLIREELQREKIRGRAGRRA